MHRWVDTTNVTMTGTALGFAKLDQEGITAGLSSLLDNPEHCLATASLVQCDNCRQAAEGGDAEAHAHLGHMYANGVGVDQSNETARQYLQGAADAGNPSGQFGLGYMHLTGQAVQQDYSTAFKLFQHASEAVSLCLWFASLLPSSHAKSYHVHQALHLLAHHCSRCS